MTASARTTWQSFSTKPSSVARAPATCSTSCWSNTFETQEGSVIADPATHTLGNGDDPARRDLGRPSGTVRLLKPCWRGLDAETAERFRREGAQPLDRGGRAIEGRRRRPGVEPMPDLHQLPCADQMAQHTTDLVIAAEVAEILAQKHVATLAGQALQDTGFEVFGLHIVPPHHLSQYDIILKILTGKSIVSSAAAVVGKLPVLLR